MFCCSLLLICVLSCAVASNAGVSLPMQVQLGGAIVAAVEDDAEQEEQEMRNAEWHRWSDGVDLMELERMLSEIGEGRGKFRKQRKMLKYLYPLIVGVFVAKVVLVPLVLKALTALSAMSFVMSKIALITTGFLALRWILAGSSGGEGSKERLEIVHLPAALKAYHGGAGWDDLSLSSSNFVDVPARQQRQKYIPVGGQKDGVAVGAGGAVGGVGTSAYRHQQHNYESSYNGLPFL